MLSRRQFAASALALAASGGRAGAESTWPPKTIRFVIPFPPAGANDVIGRIMADKLAKALNVTVVVDNRPGAGGTIGAAAVSKMEPDGSAIMVGYIGNLGYAPTIYEKLPYDPVNSFEPISLVAKVPNVLVVNPSLPIKSVEDLVHYSTNNPGKMAYSSGGNGTAAHIGMAYLCKMARLQMIHVPYRGTAPSLMDLIAGRVQVTMAGWPGIGPFVKSGQLRAIGVSALNRVPFAPEIPAIAETLQGFDAVQWYGILAPARTPAPIVDRLNAEIASILKTPELLSYLTNEGALPTGSSPQEFRAYIRSEIDRWKEAIIAAGIEKVT